MNKVFFTTKINSSASDIKTVSANAYEQLCKRGDCYEVLPDERPIKLYLDVDIKYEGDDMDLYNEATTDFIIQHTERELTKVIGEFDVKPIFHHAISNSPSFVDFKKKTTLAKISIHTVVENVIAFKHQQLLLVKVLNNHILKYHPDIVDCIGEGNKLYDETVYDKNRKMRSVYASKPDEKRPLVIYKGSFEGLVISAFIPDNAQIMPEIIQETPPSKPLVIASNGGQGDKYNRMYFEGFLEKGALAKYADEYLHWRNIGFILKYEFKEDGWELFKSFSALSPRYDNEAGFYEVDCRAWWDKWDESPAKPLTIATLISDVKKDNKEIYDEVHKSITALKGKDKSQKTNMKIGDYDLAKELYTDWGMNFVCTNLTANEWYKFNEDAIWKYEESGNEIRRIISNQFRDKYTQKRGLLEKKLQVANGCKDEMEIKIIRDELGKVIQVEQRLGMTNEKKNIMTELKELSYNGDFVKSMNKELYVLPLRNKTNINLKTLETYQRTINDKFDYECKASYVELSCEEKLFVEKYFNDLFMGNTELIQCVLDIIKSMMAGIRLRYIFFGTGTGRNGKSLFFKILQLILTESCMNTISHSVIIESKGFKSPLNTELEKLDKVRIGLVSELKDTDTLNDTVVRQITGGDAMDLRTINTKNKTILPTANLFGITNELPRFTPIQANIDRIKVVPFKNTFENNLNYENEMMGKSDLIFSYILKYGNIRANYDVCPDVMNEATKAYVSENNEDSLKEFIESRMERKEGARIKQEDFRRDYNIWLDTMGYKRDTRKNTGFTKDMTRHGIKNTRSHNTNYYLDITFKTNSEFNDTDEEDGSV